MDKKSNQYSTFDTQSQSQAQRIIDLVASRLRFFINIVVENFAFFRNSEIFPISDTFHFFTDVPIFICFIYRYIPFIFETSQLQV